MRPVALIALALFALVALVARSPESAAQRPRPSEQDRVTPALFKADNVRHDRELGLVIATGTSRSPTASASCSPIP